MLSYVLALVVVMMAAIPGFAAPPRISSFQKDGTLVWTNALVPGVCTVEMATTPGGPWWPATNAFTTNSSGRATVVIDGQSKFHRLLAVDIGGTPQGFTNLAYAYGNLETIAGTGAGQLDGVSYWEPWYEGYYARWAALSRPHFAMADRAGNIYIADKNSHSILKVTPDGMIHTYAGNHVGGFNGDGPSAATNLSLNFPNGCWVRADGTVYIQDTDNGRVRRVDTSGIMGTFFMATSDGSPVSGGRGLWVKDDESLAYFCAGAKLKKWTPAGGVNNLATGFIELGTLVVDQNGNVIVGDRGANRVYRVTPAGSTTVVAGNGTTSGGGEGHTALETGLWGVRAVWPVPNGGYLLGTHDGSQVWYMDPGGLMHLWLNGAGGRTHYGDGSFFYSPEAKISEVRSVTMDYEGNIIITESDYGFVRRIRFLPTNR